MWAMPTTPAQVIADLLGRYALECVIQRLDANRAVAFVGFQPHPDTNSIPQRRQPRVIDLEQEPSLGNHLVFDAHGLSERKHKLLLRLVVLVLTPRLETRRGCRGEERIPWRRIAQGVLEAVDFPL